MVQRIYGAFNRGDAGAVLALVAPEIVIEDFALPDKTVYQGVEGVVKFLAFQAEIFADTQLETQEFIDAGDRLVAIVRITAAGPSSGIPVAGELGHIWKLADSKAVSLRIVRNRSEALAAVGLLE